MAKAKYTSKNRWALFLLILLGIVFGSFIGYLVRGVDFLSWLNYGIDFSIGESSSKVVTLDLGILVLHFGLRVKFTIASVVGAIIAILIFKKI